MEVEEPKRTRTAFCSGGRFNEFDGNHRIFCNGRVIVGPHWTTFLMTHLFIIVPSVLFCIFGAPQIYMNLSPAFLVIGMLLVILSEFTLILTGITDPGIHPKQERDWAVAQDTDEEEEAEESEDSTDKDLDSDYTSTYIPEPPPKHKEVTLPSGETILLKYCYTCNFYRKPRMVHCSFCNSCIDEFDHHCPTCIGKRNYKYFYTFVMTACLLCVYGVAMNLLNIFMTLLFFFMDGGFNKNAPDIAWFLLTRCGASAFAAAYAGLMLFSVSPLAIFHTYLIAKGKTTYEHLKDTYVDRENPYTRGCIQNYNKIYCNKEENSLILDTFIEPRDDEKLQETLLNRLENNNI
eukprot:gene4764-8346_t